MPRKRPVDYLDFQDQHTLAKVCGDDWRNLTLIRTIELLCDHIQNLEVKNAS